MIGLIPFVVVAVPVERLETVGGLFDEGVKIWVQGSGNSRTCAPTQSDCIRKLHHRHSSAMARSGSTRSAWSPGISPIICQLARIMQVAIKNDGPIFGQSGRS